MFRRIRRASTASTVPPTVVDVPSTEVESNMPATHPLTDVDLTESVASSGFLIDVEAFPARMDAPDSDGEDDDESASCQTGASEVHEVSNSEQEEAESNLATPVVQLGTQSLRGGLQSLDMIDLVEVWKVQGNLMKSVPKFMQGAYPTGMRQALDAVSLGEERGDDLLQIRGWKLFFLLPRMFLYRPSRGGQVPKKTLSDRVDLFQRGQWVELVEMSLISSVEAASASSRRRRRFKGDNVEQLARIAFHMVQLGEVSAGRQALDGACLAPGDLKTLKALEDPIRHPPVPRDPLPDSIAQCELQERFSLSQELFFQNVRRARKGAAPGPSGMTADHLRPLLEHHPVAAALGHAALLMAQNKFPEEVMNALRHGRLTALRKPDGGVRGIVVGDVFRRVVAQYALKTKAGCETVAHILQVLTDLDPDATVVSVDGVGAFDLISRNSMMEGLRRVVDGEQILPFVRAFYGQPSTYFWEDDSGEVHTIPQGEGGEQGDQLLLEGS